jgi:hypothetical protein
VKFEALVELSRLAVGRIPVISWYWVTVISVTRRMSGDSSNYVIGIIFAEKNNKIKRRKENLIWKSRKKQKFIFSRDY